MSRRVNIIIGLSVAAAAAATLATRGLIGSARRNAEAAPAKLEARAADARARLESAMSRLTRPLEIDVARAAAVPELKAALAEHVDGATILDLFDTEDWWTPFRARAAAVVASGEIVAARGEKNPPLPAGLAPSPADPSVAAGLVVAPRPLVAAAAPIDVPARPERIVLVLSAPFDAATLAASAGGAIALSDGHAVVLSTGDEAQKKVLAGLPGKESSAVIADPDGLVAVAIPAGPSLWLWTLASMPAPPPEVWTDPRLWSALVGLLVLVAVLVWSTRPRAAVGPGATIVGPGATIVAPAVVTSPAVSTTAPAIAPEPRMAATMILGPTTQGAEDDPSMFGRYRLLRRLDGGGMADIYTAVLDGAEGFQRTLVIKRLRPELTRSRGAVEQFIDEAKLGSVLAHPNIVPVLDFGKVGDEYFMAEEYVVGRDVSRLVQRHFDVTGRPLDEKVALFIAHEILEALAYAHAHVGPDGTPLAIVHRDISPGNIMVTGRGDVKLFDFGIVKAIGRVSRTEVGVVKGNVSFMSPEQARGQPVDARSDLFSLGLVIYYALTNEQIYRGAGTFEQLLQAASGPTREDLTKLEGLPVASRILQRAIAVSPADRYQSAAEFAADLAPHVAGGRPAAAALVQQLFGDELRAAAAG